MGCIVYIWKDRMSDEKSYLILLSPPHRRTLSQGSIQPSRLQSMRNSLLEMSYDLVCEWLTWLSRLGRIRLRNHSLVSVAA